MRQSYGFLLRIRSKLHSLTFNLCKVASLTEIFLFLIEELINQPHRLILLLIHNLSVYLGGGYSGVTEQLAGGVDVGSQREHHGGEGVPSGMEGYVLLDSCCLRPYLNMIVDVWLLA